MKLARAIFWFFCGVGCVILVQWLIKFNWNWEMKATDLLQITVAVIIAIRLQHITAVKYQDTRVVKDMLTKRVGAIEANVERLQYLVGASFHEQKVKSQEIISFKTDFNNLVYHLEKSFEKCRINLKDFEELKKLRGEYNDIITGNNFPEENYTPEIISKSQQLHRKINDVLFSLSYDITHHEMD